MSKSITIIINDDYYSRFEYLANDLGKTVEAYAKQTIENKTDAFYAGIKEINDARKEEQEKANEKIYFTQVDWDRIDQLY